MFCFKLFLFIHLLIHLLFPVEDLERNDGSSEKPYYMSKDLMKILGKKNKKADKNKNGDAVDGEANGESNRA